MKLLFLGTGAGEGVAIEHTDRQGSQKVGTGDGNHSCKGDSCDGQRHNKHQMHGEGRKIHQNQTDVALDTAIAPDLLVHFTDKTGRKHAKKKDTGQEQLLRDGQVIVTFVQKEKQQMRKSKNCQIVCH